MLCIIIAYLHLGGSSCVEFFNGIFFSPSHSVRIVFFTVNIFYARAMTVTTTRVIMHARVQCVCIFSSFFFLYIHRRRRYSRTSAFYIGGGVDRLFSSVRDDGMRESDLIDCLDARATHNN